MMLPTGGGMREAANDNEQLPGVQIKKIGVSEMNELGSQIRHLRYDALDTDRNRGPAGERRADFKEIKHEAVLSRHHEDVFVAMENGTVVGFLALEKGAGIEGRHADIQALWTDRPGRRQKAIVGKLLAETRGYLREHHHQRLEMDPEKESGALRKVAQKRPFDHFLRVHEGGEELVAPEAANDTSFPADEEGDAPLEKAA